MRIGRTYIALTFREFAEADHAELCKRLGIETRPTTDDSWVDDEANKQAEAAIRQAQAT